MLKTAAKLETINTGTSSMFTKLTYLSGVLNVFLRNHTQYEYKQIPQRMWDEMKVAASIGSYYNTYIKGVYQFTRKI